MTLNIDSRVCQIEPFRYQSTPQPGAEDGASGNQINEQAVEDYLSRLRTAICDDLEEIIEQAAVGEGALSFLELNDTPDSYAGAAGFNVVVNASGTGLTFTSPSTLTGFLTNRWCFLFLPGNAGAGMQQLGTGTIAQNGTASTQVVATTNHLTSFYRTRYAAAAAGIAGIRQSVAQVLRGASAPQGGFKCLWRWGTATAVATQRSFVGLNANVNFVNVNPSTLTNVFGVGYDAGATEFSLIHNDNAGGATSTPLGASFPVNASSVFQLAITCDPSATSIEWELTNLTTGDSTSGSVNTELPVNTTALTPIGWVSSTALASQIEFISCYLEAAR